MKYLRICLFLASVPLFIACGKKYDPSEFLTQKDEQELLFRLSRYICEKPKGVSYEVRFDPIHDEYYKKMMDVQESRMQAFHKKDSVSYYLVIKKDLTSLYDHYRYFGGTFKTDEEGNIIELDQKMVSPRLFREDAVNKGKELFAELVEKGNVDEYFGNTACMEWPNPDVAYDVQKKKWVFPEGSRFRIFEEFDK